MSELEGAITRPDVPRHFMVLKPVGQQVIVRHGDLVLAQSDKAVWLLEAGKSLYAPVIYLPNEDLKIEMEREDKSTHCPLKGDASYFSVPGDENAQNIAWSYEDPFEFSQAIKGFMAFYSDRVTIQIGT